MTIKSLRPDGNDKLLGVEDRKLESFSDRLLGDPPSGNDGLKRAAPSPQDQFFLAGAEAFRAATRLMERCVQQLDEEEDKRS